MKHNVQVLIGGVAAAALACWTHVTLPSAGLVVFLSAAIAAFAWAVLLLFRRSKAPSPKSIWKALGDFFWGMSAWFLPQWPKLWQQLEMVEIVENYD